MSPEATKPWNLKDEIDEVRRLTEGLRGIRAELSKLDVEVSKIQSIQVPMWNPWSFLEAPCDQTQGPFGLRADSARGRPSRQ
jgi:hypothetical protein